MFEDFGSEVLKLEHVLDRIQGREAFWAEKGLRDLMVRVVCLTSSTPVVLLVITTIMITHGYFFKHPSVSQIRKRGKQGHRT